MAPFPSQAPVSPAHPELSDEDIAKRFGQRCELVLREGVAEIAPRDVSKGNKFDVAACLRRGEKVEAALARLAMLDRGRPSGDMFWVYPTVAVMMVGRKHFDAADQKRIAELGRIYCPSLGDTENLWVLSYASL